MPYSAPTKWGPLVFGAVDMVLHCTVISPKANCNGLASIVYDGIEKGVYMALTLPEYSLFPGNHFHFHRNTPVLASVDSDDTEYIDPTRLGYFPDFIYALGRIPIVLRICRKTKTASYISAMIWMASAPCGYSTKDWTPPTLPTPSNSWRPSPPACASRLKPPNSGWFFIF